MAEKKKQNKFNSHLLIMDGQEALLLVVTQGIWLEE